MPPAPVRGLREQERGGRPPARVVSAQRCCHGDHAARAERHGTPQNAALRTGQIPPKWCSTVAAERRKMESRPATKKPTNRYSAIAPRTPRPPPRSGGRRSSLAR